MSSQQRQHYELIVQTLSKILQQQLQRFQAAIACHSENINNRQQRVQKYGIALPEAPSSSEQYSFADPSAGIALRRRAPPGPISYPAMTPYDASSGPNNGQMQAQTQQYIQRPALTRNDRLAHAKRIESTIAQVGCILLLSALYLSVFLTGWRAFHTSSAISDGAIGNHIPYRR